MIGASVLTEWTTSLFVAMGCSHDDARVVASVLVEAELRGVPSHGLTRVTDYYLQHCAKRVNLKPNIQVVYQSPSTATMDGDGCLGPVVAVRAMQLAIEKARKSGTGWVAVRGSSYYGVASYYAKQAIANDMVGISTTNGNPIVAPVFSTSRMLGTNPLAVAIPTQKNRPLIFDMATSAISRGRLHILSKERRDVSLGLVQDAMGSPTRDPKTIERGGSILPLGGDLAHGAHKGFCMGAIVDIFSGIFSGANFGPFVPPQLAFLPERDEQVGSGLGHFFGAMRIDAFRPAAEFKAAVDKWIETFRTARGVVGTPGVQIPGQVEQECKEIRLRSGIPLMPYVRKDLSRIAKALRMNELPYTPDL